MLSVLRLLRRQPGFHIKSLSVIPHQQSIVGFSHHNLCIELNASPHSAPEKKIGRKKTSHTTKSHVHSTKKPPPDQEYPTSSIPSNSSFSSSQNLMKDDDEKVTKSSLPSIRYPVVQTSQKWDYINNTSLKAAILITQGDDLLENHTLSPFLREKVNSCLHYLKGAFPFWRDAVPRNSRLLSDCIAASNPRDEIREFLLKVERFNKEYSPFLQACIDIGEADKAMNFLQNLRHLGRRLNALNSGSLFMERRIYERLLQHYHTQPTGALSAMHVLFTWMHQDQIVPSPLALLRYLDAFGRSESTNMGHLRDLVQKMHFHGVDLMQCLRSHMQIIQDTPALQLRNILVAVLMSHPELESDVRDLLAKHPVVPAVPTPEPTQTPSAAETSSSTEQTTWMWPLTSQELETATQRQFAIESEGGVTLTPVAYIEHQYRSKKNQERLRKQLMDFRKESQAALLKALERKVVELHEQHAIEKFTLYPFLKLLPASEYVDIMMKEFDSLARETSKQHVTSYVVHSHLGRKVEEAVLLKKKHDSGIVNEIQTAYRIYLHDLGNSSPDNRNERQLWNKHEAMHRKLAAMQVDIYPWDTEIISKLGKCLYDLLHNTIKIDVSRFTFLTDGGDISTAPVQSEQSTTKKTGKTKKLKKKTEEVESVVFEQFVEYPDEVRREVKVHPILQAMYKYSNFFPLHFSPVELPMLCPPVPWLSNSKSGYFLSSNYATSLLREVNEYEQAQDIVEQLLQETEIPAVLDSMNALGNVAWRVNTRVLDLVLHVFKHKGDKKLNIPPPETECPLPPIITDGMSSQEMYAAMNRTKELRKQRMEMRSLWLSELYRLSIANDLRDRVFWFPHSMDFRGRAYPCPPHFNHMGGDMARGLMRFAEGKPLGEHGLDWLLIHLVNLTGMKKRAANDERLKFANEMMSEIIDSAEKPFIGRRWWQNDEDPWQTLACCLEVYSALRHPEGVTKFISHLPVHQDGSCNGLQHYAAMGRDIQGANSVNLTNQPVPQDVYSDVCALVEERRMKDASAGLPVAQVLEGFVRRKVIKQSVMTTVYGVTLFGAVRQITRQLSDLDDFPKEHIDAAAAYLATHTLKCISQIFTSSTEIQDWISKLAYRTAKDRQCLMEWQTPLGLPVVQPYVKEVNIVYPTLFSEDSQSVNSTPTTPPPQSSTPSSSGRHLGRYLLWTQSLVQPSPMKQRSACPPNFVHSLDATHMMLTALHCIRKGITFAAVHDCFWTHASQVPEMNRICREEFINLHSQPILENLSSYVSQRFAFSAVELDEMTNEREKARALAYNNLIKTIPQKGSLDLNEVMKSTYFFS